MCVGVYGSSAELCFTLEALTGTSDSCHRRKKLLEKHRSKKAPAWAAHYSNNTVCFFCRGDEGSDHYLTCKPLLRRFQPLIRAAQELADPFHVLPPSTLDWCFGNVHRPTSTGDIKVRDENWPRLLESFARHPTTAGAIGLLPACAQNVYQLYWGAMEPTLTQQEVRKRASSTIACTRAALFKVAFCAWKLWRSRKKRNIAARRKLLNKKARLQRQAEAARLHEQGLADLRNHAARLRQRRLAARSRWRPKWRRPRCKKIFY